jgi:HEAT repeat protein
MKNIRNFLYILVPILVLIIESVFIIGCAQNLPASSFGSSDQVLETSDLETSDAVTIPISSVLLTYENTVYNFRIGYPQDWQAREADPNNMGLVYGMLTPEEDDDNPLNYLIVQVEPLPAGATLAQYTQALIQTMRQSNANLQILSTEATTLGGNPANELFITTQDQYNYLKVLKVYTIKDGKAYIITYNTLEENFDYYLETAREVIVSFEFMGTEKTILPGTIKEIKKEPEVVTPGPNVLEMKRVESETAPETTDEVQTQIRALKDENSFVRAEACDALSGLQDPRAVDPLIQALQDSDFIIRSHAADALGEINDSRAVEPLILALKDEDSSVRAKACIALGELKDPRAVEPLIEALRDDDINTTVYARISLGEIGSSAVDPLIQALQNKDYLIRSRAAYTLGLIQDDRAVEPLIQVLSDEEWVVRENAAEALGMIKDERAVEPLILAIKDDDYIVRKRAAESLGEIGDLRAVEALKEALKDENSDVQSIAKEALAKIENDRGI